MNTLKKSPPKKKFSKTKQCLLLIGDSLREQGDVWANFMIGMTDPFYHGTLIHSGPEGVRARRHYRAERAYKQHLALLKRQGWIQMRRIGKELCIALTDKGKMIHLKESMKNASHCAENECVIVIFDIPEKERSLRQQFRLLLRECDFQQLQRSVWMSHQNVLALLKEFIRSTQSKKWIRSFRAHDVAEVE